MDIHGLSSVYSASVVDCKIQQVLFQHSTLLSFRLSADSQKMVSIVGSILVQLLISAWAKYNFTERFTMQIAKSTLINTNLIKRF